MNGNLILALRLQNGTTTMNEASERLLQIISNNAQNGLSILNDPNTICFSELKQLSEDSAFGLDKKRIANPYLLNLKECFVKHHVPPFNNVSDVDTLTQNVNVMCSIVERYLKVLSIIESALGLTCGSLTNDFIVFIQSTLFYKLTIDQRDYHIKKNLSDIFVEYFKLTFSAFASSMESEDPSETERNEQIIYHFKQFCRQLQLLQANFMNSICSNSWISFMFSAIREKITEVSTTDFEQEILEYIRQWKEHIIYQYMDIYFCGDTNHVMYHTLRTQVDYFVFESLAKIRFVSFEFVEHLHG